MQTGTFPRLVSSVRASLSIIWDFYTRGKLSFPALEYGQTVAFCWNAASIKTTCLFASTSAVKQPMARALKSDSGCDWSTPSAVLVALIQVVLKCWMEIVLGPRTSWKWDWRICAILLMDGLPTKATWPYLCTCGWRDEARNNVKIPFDTLNQHQLPWSLQTNRSGVAWLIDKNWPNQINKL